MSCLYCLWDILDDLVFRKAHESDAAKFAKLCGNCMSSRIWGVLWFFISLVFFIAGILIGLAVFKGKEGSFLPDYVVIYESETYAIIDDQQTQQQQANAFGPT